MRCRSILILTLAAAGCAKAPPPVVPTGPLPPTAEEKLAWILQLEDQRVARGPAPGQNLIDMISDPQAHIRRRAALAAGRARIREAVQALSALVQSEPDPEVRQMAAFALGLIGDRSAADVLISALATSEPLTQGRAAEALGVLGHAAAATAIGSMVAAHIAGGALDGLAPDDLGYPRSPPTEAVRLGIYALVRLGSFDVLASTLLDADGAVRSRWWPIAYALQRVGDPRSAGPLMTLLTGEGQITRAFAARGLGVMKHAPAAETLTAMAADPAEPQSVRVQAVRALAAMRPASAAATIVKMAAAQKIDPNLRLEATTALGQIGQTAAVEVLIDLASASWPALRAAALTSLARIDVDVFISVLSGLPPDPHWSVRAALADALGDLGAERGGPRLAGLIGDADQRVVAAALRALARSGAPSAVPTLIDRLSSEDPVVRLAAASGLAELKAVEAVPAVRQALEQSKADGTYVARAAILSALAALDPAGASAGLREALSDSDWAVRVRAAELLRRQDPDADVTAMAPAPEPVVPELTDVARLRAPPFSPVAYIDTTKGMIQVELAVVDAPRTVANVMALARRGFFNNLPLHRVVPDFVVQGGDPRGDGEGGPGYTIRDEINQRPYLRGTVGMALDWADTGGSQFFITHSPQPHLDGRYTVFGQVVAGMDVVDALSQWDEIVSLRVWDGTSWQGGAIDRRPR